MPNARQRWLGKGEATVRQELYEPLFGLLGFKLKENKKPTEARTSARLHSHGTDGKTAAFVYAWDRWLDGPDLNDPDTPEENPGACVVTALDAGTRRLDHRDQRQAVADLQPPGPCTSHELLRGRSGRGADCFRRHRPQRSLPLLVVVLLRPVAFEPEAEGQGMLAR